MTIVAKCLVIKRNLRNTSWKVIKALDRVGTFSLQKVHVGMETCVSLVINKSLLTITDVINAVLKSIVSLS